MLLYHKKDIMSIKKDGSTREPQYVGQARWYLITSSCLLFAWWNEFIDLLKIDDVLCLDLYPVFEYAGSPVSVN
jgi:hypothetical protein